jgi:hypothetical protein
MYAGEPPRTWVAYVGMAANVHRRLSQHFINRDSSVITAGAVRLDLEYIRYVEWWEHEDFSDGAKLHAAELVAFDVFEPVLRSRGSPTRAAVEHYEDPAFRERFEQMFIGGPTGRMLHSRLPDLARKVHSLEERVRTIEEKLADS